MDYLSIKKKQNDRIKKLLKHEPAHLKFILGKMKRTKGPHKIIIKGPKRSRPRSKGRSKARSKGRSKVRNIFTMSKPRSKPRTISKPKSNSKRSKTISKRSKIGNSIFKIFSSGSKKHSKSMNPLLRFKRSV